MFLHFGCPACPPSKFEFMLNWEETFIEVLGFIFQFWMLRASNQGGGITIGPHVVVKRGVTFAHTGKFATKREFP